MAVVEKRGGHVALLPSGEAVSGVFSLADDFAAVVGAEEGAADLVEVIGLGRVGLVGFVEQAEAVNVVGFGAVGIGADEEFSAGVDGVAGGAGGIGEGAAAALGIVSETHSSGVGELVAGVVGEIYCRGETCGHDAHTPCHVAIGIVGDGLAVGSEQAVVVVVGGDERGVLPTGVDERGAETGFDLSRSIVLERKVVDELAT